jgi:hypothetical protein
VADDIGQQVERFLRNALQERAVEDRQIRTALRGLRRVLQGVNRSIEDSGILAPGPGRDARIRGLVNAIAQSVQQTWGVPVLQGMQEAMIPWVERQLDFARDMVRMSGGSLIDPGAVAPPPATVAQMVNGAIVDGKTLADSLAVSVPAQVADRVERYIRMGLSDVAGETVAVYDDAVVRVVERNVEALIRTGVHEVGSAAQNLIYQIETDPDWLGPDGLVWTATLDSAVCPTCVALDGKRYQNGEPGPYWDGKNKISPHRNCRCYLLPWKWAKDMESPDGGKEPTTRLAEGDKGEEFVPVKQTVDKWLRANPQTTALIFGKARGKALLEALNSSDPKVRRSALSKAVRDWQAPKGN